MTPNLNGQNIFTVVLICGSGLLAIFLLFRVSNHPPNFGSVRGNEQRIQGQIDEVFAKIEKQRLNVENLNPGPQPSWFHLYDNFNWYIKNSEYQKAKKVLDKLEREKDQLIYDLKHDSWVMIKSIIGTIWADVIRPVLEIVLLLTVLSFGLRVLLRHMLMHGKFGVTRV